SKTVIFPQGQGLVPELQAQTQSGKEKEERNREAGELIQENRKVGYRDEIAGFIEIHDPEVDAMGDYDGYAGENPEEFTVLFRQVQTGSWICRLDGAPGTGKGKATIGHCVCKSPHTPIDRTQTASTTYGTGSRPAPSTLTCKCVIPAARTPPSRTGHSQRLRNSEASIQAF